MTEEITLTRAYDKIPWGFRLMGGVDFGSPLTILRLTANSVAEQQGLKAGDIITEIGDVKTTNLTHAEAQHHIIGAKNHLRLLVLRGSYADVARAVTPVRGLTPLSFCSVEKRKTVSTASIGSINSLCEYDSFEYKGQSDEDHHNEQHEPTEEEIEEMPLENAEVIEEKGKSAIGVNFRRFIPKCDFIKDSAVFHVLQEEQVHKELSEKEQLAKCPNKRFSTFLLHPDRPIPEPKNKNKEEEQLETKTMNTPNAEPQQESALKSDINDSKPVCQSPITVTTSSYENDECDKTNTFCNIESSDNEQNSITVIGTTKPADQNEIISESSEVQIVQITNDDSESDDFENKLNQIKNTLTMLKELPLIIQSQLATVQTQINNLLPLKGEHTKADTTTAVTTNNKNEQNEIDDSSLIEANLNKQDTIQETIESIRNDEQEEFVEMKNETSTEETKDIEFTEDHEIEEDRSNENDQRQAAEDEDAEERQMHRRRICPLTPMPRPVVLPGGRIWRKPKDAYNEEFIAETLISQAEVIVGSTLGVNFRKYEPPKLDLSNSAVYKLIHNLEDKKVGLEERDTTPALQDYYQPPISAKHFYLASLADKIHNASDVTKSNEVITSSE